MRDLLLLGETFCVLVMMKVALRVVPVRRIVAWQGSHRAGKTDERWARRVRWAVGVVAHRSPVEFVCFPQCLAGAWLLGREGVGSRLHYGVKRAGAKLETHTWLESGGEVLIGGEVRGDFVEVEGFGVGAGGSLPGR